MELMGWGHNKYMAVVCCVMGATLSGCANVPRVDTGQIGLLQSGRRVANYHVSERGVIPADENEYLWPVEHGSISSPFGDRSKRRRHHFHEGVDIKANRGEPVMAAKDGMVIYSSKRIKGYGNMVVLKHENGSATVYAHNKVNLVVLGERVSRGQVIAQVGATGRATGPHVHFEIRKGELPIDPLLYVTPNRAPSSFAQSGAQSNLPQGSSKKRLN